MGLHVVVLLALVGATAANCPPTATCCVQKLNGTDALVYDLSVVPEYEWAMSQYWVDENISSPYWWVSNWCANVTHVPTGLNGTTTPCDDEYGNHGHIQQFTETGEGNGRCEVAFDTNFTMWLNDTTGSHEEWIEMEVRHIDKDDQRLKIAKVVIQCDAGMESGNFIAPNMYPPYVRVTGSRSGPDPLYYQYYFKSPCACANNEQCVGVTPPPAVPVPPDQVNHVCALAEDNGTVRDIQNGAASAKVLTMPQYWIQGCASTENQTRNHCNDTYTWVVGWCWMQQENRTVWDQCSSEGGRGYLQQLEAEGCASDFNRWGNISSWTQTYTNSYASYAPPAGGGIDITVHEDGVYTKTAHLLIGCNSSLTTGEIVPVMPTGHVVVDGPTAFGSELKFLMHFESACACEDGLNKNCIVEPPLPFPNWTDIPPPPPDNDNCVPNGQSDKDTTNVEAYQFVARVFNPAATPKTTYESYNWLASFCNPIDPYDKNQEFANHPCLQKGNKGYLMYAHEGHCIGSWGKWDGMLDYVMSGGLGTKGVTIMLVDDGGYGLEKRYANIEITCNPDGAENVVEWDYFMGDTVHREAWRVEQPYGMVYNYSFQLFSKCACPGGCNNKPPPVPPPTPEAPKKKMNGGVVFLIILLVVLFMYIVGGIAFNVVVKGRRGFPEVLPNYEFWSSIPGRFSGGGGGGGGPSVKTTADLAGEEKTSYQGGKGDGYGAL